MPLSEPGWWYGPGRPGVARALAPIGWLWGRAALRRLARGEAYVSMLPVICVGNFTAGGTGKTPLVLAIARFLSARGHRPAILTRGYGGRVRGPHWVDLSRDTAGSVGDEARLLARGGATLIARDRAAGAATIERDARRFDAIVMDDGLQNPTLAKSLTIAVVDGARGFGNGGVIPAGPLRAPFDQLSARTDVMVVNQTGTETVGSAALLERLRREFTGPVISAATRADGDTAWLAERTVVAYAGIGHPARFFRLLAAHGARLAAEIALPDHHVFTIADARNLLDLAKRHDAQLVTTEKDLARLAGATGVLGDLARTSRPLAITLRIDAADAARFDHLLLDALARRPDRRGPAGG